MSDMDEDLARLGRATDAIRPRAGFVIRVENAIAEKGASLPPSSIRDVWDDVRLSARRLIPMAALAALVSLFFAARTASAFDEAVIDAVEESSDVTW